MSQTPTRLKKFVISAFIVIVFIPLLHYNLVPAVLHDQLYEDPFRSTLAPYSKFLESARQLGLATVWRMYSPGRKRCEWVEWFEVDQDQNKTLLEVPNLSPRHKPNRSLDHVFLWDFRLPIFQISVGRSDYKLPRVRYTEFLCKKLKEERGSSPWGISARRVRVLIPPPGTEPSFSCFRDDFSQVIDFGVIPCR